jgi:hypothetical protein
MKSHIPAFLFVFLYTILTNSSVAQTHVVSMTENDKSLNGGLDRWGRPAPNSVGWTDPALDHNKLLQQQTGEGMYKMIGTYKVVGSSFLLGVRHPADIFAPEVKAYNIFISYNTYNQEIEFYSIGNPDKPLVRDPGTLDSFIIHQDTGRHISNQLKFVYGSVLGIKDKYYFQEICTGKRFNLYKRYKSELGYVSSNYIQSELRQFDLVYDYFYTDTESKGIKKIKPNAYSVIKVFQAVKDLTTVVTVDDFSANPEVAFRKAFAYLNN